MIKYNLKCDNEHEFESWFSDSNEFDNLKKKKLLECIFCSSKKINKSIMAPMVSGTRENINETEELNKNLGEEFSLDNLDRLFQVILKSATYEFLYKPNLSIKIIIKEYLDASNFFLDDGQTKYLNALLDNIGKKLRSPNA